MRRHNFDPISFILGALFAAIGLTFLFGNADLGDFHLAVVWPLPLIVIGLLMLVTTLQRRSRHEAALTPAPPPSTVAATVPTPATVSAPVAGSSGFGHEPVSVDGGTDEIHKAPDEIDGATDEIHDTPDDVAGPSDDLRGATDEIDGLDERREDDPLD